MTDTDDLCDCKLCIANLDHPARRFHNLFVRLRHLLTREELAACVVQYADLTQMGDGDEDILCQMSTLSGDDLQAARAVVTADQSICMGRPIHFACLPIGWRTATCSKC